MSDNELQRLARLCAVIDHLQDHGSFGPALERLSVERDQILAALLQPQSIPQKPTQKGKR